MTGYGGYFMQGMASGLESGMAMGAQLLELKWKKKAKEDAEKADKAMIDALSNLNAIFQNNGTYDSIGLGGGYDLGTGIGQTTETLPQLKYNLNTPSTNINPPLTYNSNNLGLPKTGSIGVLASKEGMAVIAASLALSDAKASIVKDIMLAIDKGDREKYAESMDYYKNLTGYIADFNKMGVSIEDGVNGLKNILPEKSLKYINMLDTYGKTPAANMPYEMTKQMGEEVGFNMPGEMIPTPKEPTTEDRKFDWAIDNYNKGLINFDELKKYMGTDKDLSAKQQEVELAKQYGATNEEIKKMLLGVRPSTPLIVKMVDPNDVLFGTNGIMKDYINSGSQLGEEQKAEIRNNYNVVKPALSEETRKQVEDYLQQIGIDLAETEPISEPEPEPTKSNWFKDTWKKMTTPGGTPAYEGTPKISTEGKEAMIPMMTNDELYNALKGLDPSDPIYKALYDEAVKRGLIEK